MGSNGREETDGGLFTSQMFPASEGGGMDVEVVRERGRCWVCVPASFLSLPFYADDDMRKPL